MDNLHDIAKSNNDLFNIKLDDSFNI